MAEYCSACSRDIFKRDGRDFHGLTSVDDFSRGRACVVVCEGCSIIQVDPYGRCLTACSRQNYPGHNISWSVPPKVSILTKVFLWMFNLVLKFLK
jgi:hypothetical protein